MPSWQLFVISVAMFVYQKALKLAISWWPTSQPLENIFMCFGWLGKNIFTHHHPHHHPPWKLTLSDRVLSIISLNFLLFASGGWGKKTSPKCCFECVMYHGRKEQNITLKQTKFIRFFFNLVNCSHWCGCPRDSSPPMGSGLCGGQLSNRTHLGEVVVTVSYRKKQAEWNFHERSVQFLWIYTFFFRTKILGM